jgi:hypothetical protein
MINYNHPSLLSRHAHADHVSSPSAPIKGEEVGQRCLSHTQRLQDILREHSTNYSADGRKFMHCTRDHRSATLFVGII